MQASVKKRFIKGSNKDVLSKVCSNQLTILIHISQSSETVVLTVH